MSVFIYAQVRLPYTTSLPQDVAINTYSFACEDDPGPSDFEDLRDVFKANYNFVMPWLSPCIVGSDASVSYYSSSFPPSHPMTFLEEDPLETDDPSAAHGLPEEVALCLSFAGVSALGGAPTTPPNRRGRIYLGPLATAAIGDLDPASFTRPADDFMDATLSMATALAGYADGSASPFQWVVWSRATGGALTPVTHWWVDNAWDTQRRRGVDASSRVTGP